MKFFCAAAILLGLTTACNRTPTLTLPPLEDNPIEVIVQRESMPDLAPAYGISVATGTTVEFEVNIEAGDSPRIRVGQAAHADVLPARSRIPCRVARILKSASQETGQSIAWLAPTGKTSVPQGEFIFAQITMGVIRGALTVPKKALLVRDGKTWVIQKTSEGKEHFVPVEVKAKEYTLGDTAQIISGLAEGSSIVSEGGIGFLYPDFKSGQEGD